MALWRIAVLLIVGGLTLPAMAQPAGKVWRIGFLGPTSATSPVWIARVEQLKAGLRELGYVEGKNVAIEYRWADGKLERLPTLAAELVRLKPDVLVTATTPGAMAAKGATNTIPIVLASVGDPVFTGLVPNLARPGGNITGSSLFTGDESAKRLELIKDALPRTKRVAVLVNPTNPLWSASVQEIEGVARSLKLDLQRIEARTPADFESAIASAVEQRADALVVVEDSLFSAQAGKLAELALRHKLPAIGQVVFADAGGLIGNGTNQLVLFRRAAVFVDKIFKGAKPADLPIEQATRFELIVNLKTAKALGVSLPKQLTFRADRIIE
jgi:putative tryptophan/tyrosine transport system substrate-binding protein